MLRNFRVKTVKNKNSPLFSQCLFFISKTTIPIAKYRICISIAVLNYFIQSESYNLGDCYTLENNNKLNDKNNRLKKNS